MQSPSHALLRARYAILNYIEHEFNHHHSSLTIRNEFVDDLRGQRTGNKTRYSRASGGI